VDGVTRLRGPTDMTGYADRTWIVGVPEAVLKRADIQQLEVVAG
jgi:hypothetical protein